MVRIRFAAAGAALALALGACGKSGDGSSDAPLRPESTSATTPKADRDDGKGATTPARTTKTAERTTPTAGAKRPKAGARKTKDVVIVVMKDSKFVPHDIVVHLGQRVRWLNQDDAGHNVVATQGASFSSKTLKRGKRFSYLPKRLGRIRYACTIHPGQDGTISVRK